ncbi:MAG TPA: adenylyl-sulfate kinase [Candidatus Eisenbacteria bacterium]|nr:adenylyl-sulfate kinase [Candidatus Eisenbacteria bacterium]
MSAGFAVWITGLPASGKSTVARALVDALTAAGVESEVLESDALRPILTPSATYDETERDVFYRAVTHLGALLARHGVAVIFDATAPRRVHREGGRAVIPRFLEVLMDCPLETCMARDPKGIYRAAREGHATTVPGVQSRYEAPSDPDLIVRADHETPEAAAARIVEELKARGWIGRVSS